MRLVLPLLFALAAVPARAETEVDIELVLAVESRGRWRPRNSIQRRGYVDALTSDAVLSARRVKVAVLAYMEWAGEGRPSRHPLERHRTPPKQKVSGRLANTDDGDRRTSISRALTATAASSRTRHHFPPPGDRRLGRRPEQRGGR